VFFLICKHFAQGRFMSVLYNAHVKYRVSPHSLKYDDNKAKYKFSAIEPEILNIVKKWTFI
jgi:hypothetical protein